MAVIYPELVGAMEKRGLTRVTVANALGISSQTLYAKLTGKTEFTLSEASTIHSKFFPDMNKEVLFTSAGAKRSRA